MKLILHLVLLVLCTAVSAAGFENWDPVTAADWAKTGDFAKKSYDALVLFEKVTVDDHLIAERNVCTLTIYRRIKIFNAKGYKWADVSIPYVNKKQKIIEMSGRTLWPNGRIFTLTKKQIFENDVLKAKKLAVKRKAFSLAGIQDGCIIEYVIKLETPTLVEHPLTQMEIPIKTFELTWQYFTFDIPVTTTWDLQELRKIAERFTPLYRCKEIATPIVEMADASNDIPLKSVRFTFYDIPPYRPEPYSVNAQAQSDKIFIFYSNNNDTYWPETLGEIFKSYAEFNKSKELFNKVYAKLDRATDQRQFINDAYKWVQHNIKNTETMEEANLKDIKSIEDVLRLGYGSSRDINLLFRALLQRRGIPSKIGFVADRRSQIVEPEVNTMQFDDIVVMVSLTPGIVEPHAPAIPYLAPGKVPYYYEGVHSLLADSTTHNWYKIPYSTAQNNRYQRNVLIRVSEEGALAGVFQEKSQGEMARIRRTLIGQTDSAEAVIALKKEIEQLIPLAEADSITFSGAREIDQDMTITCKVTFPLLVRKTGDKYLLQPSDFIGRLKNPFWAETRTSAMLMDYPYILLETVTIFLPESWETFAIPETMSFLHALGEFLLNFSPWARTYPSNE
jgi:hypothetical protein